MNIQRYESDLLSSNMYVIVEGTTAIVIDPFRDTSVAQGLTVEKILLTHEHYDHISGVNRWKEATGAPVLCSKACGENIQSPRGNMSRWFNVFCELQDWVTIDRLPDADENYICTADEVFEDTAAFDWHGHQFRLFELPGHSLGSIGILLDGQDFFSGDSLMEGVEIALRFPGGSKAKWKAVGEPRLAALPDGIRVYPGHFQEFIYSTKKAGA